MQLGFEAHLLEGLDSLRLGSIDLGYLLGSAPGEHPHELVIRDRIVDDVNGGDHIVLNTPGQVLADYLYDLGRRGFPVRQIYKLSPGTIEYGSHFFLEVLGIFAGRALAPDTVNLLVDDAVDLIDVKRVFE